MFTVLFFIAATLNIQPTLLTAQLFCFSLMSVKIPTIMIPCFGCLPNSINTKLSDCTKQDFIPSCFRLILVLETYDPKHSNPTYASTAD